MNLLDIPQYGGQPLAVALEPVVLARKDADFIETTLTSLLRLAEDFTKKALIDPKLLKSLGLVEDLDPKPTPLGLHIPFARFDFLYDGQNLNVLELNTDGSSGFNIMEWLGLKAKIPDHENPNKDLSLRLLQALREHKPEALEIGIMDFHDVKTHWEQEDLVKTWSTQILAKRLRPDIRTWSKGSLIYRRALSWQLRYLKAEAKPFLDDWMNDKITVVGGWSSDVGMSKVWPAITNAPHFPETNLATPEVVERLKTEKDLWILKGALSFAGKAVIRGVDLSEEKWLSALKMVIEETAMGRPWIVQKSVKIPLVEGKPCEFGLYFLNGKPSGYMCRWGSFETISDKSSELMRPVRII